MSGVGTGVGFLEGDADDIFAFPELGPRLSSKPVSQESSQESSQEPSQEASQEQYLLDEFLKYPLNRELISELIGQVKNINYQDPLFGRTALHLACFLCETGLIALLVNVRRAKLNVLDAKGKSPLDILLTHKHVTSFAIKILTDKGALTGSQIQLIEPVQPVQPVQSVQAIPSQVPLPSPAPESKKRPRSEMLTSGDGDLLLEFSKACVALPGGADCQRDVRLAACKIVEILDSRRLDMKSMIHPKCQTAASYSGPIGLYLCRKLIRFSSNPEFEPLRQMLMSRLPIVFEKKQGLVFDPKNPQFSMPYPPILMEACEGHHGSSAVEMVEALVALGADPRVSFGGKTPLICAFESFNRDNFLRAALCLCRAGAVYDLDFTTSAKAKTKLTQIVREALEPYSPKDSKEIRTERTQRLRDKFTNAFNFFYKFSNRLSFLDLIASLKFFTLKGLNFELEEFWETLPRYRFQVAPSGINKINLFSYLCSKYAFCMGRVLLREAEHFRKEFFELLLLACRSGASVSSEDIAALTLPPPALNEELAAIRFFCKAEFLQGLILGAKPAIWTQEDSKTLKLSDKGSAAASSESSESRESSVSSDPALLFLLDFRLNKNRKNRTDLTLRSSMAGMITSFL